MPVFIGPPRPSLSERRTFSGKSHLHLKYQLKVFHRTVCKYATLCPPHCTASPAPHRIAPHKEGMRYEPNGENAEKMLENAGKIQKKCPEKCPEKMQKNTKKSGKIQRNADCNPPYTSLPCPAFHGAFHALGCTVNQDMRRTLCLKASQTFAFKYNPQINARGAYLLEPSFGPWGCALIWAPFPWVSFVFQ